MTGRGRGRGKGGWRGKDRKTVGKDESNMGGGGRGGYGEGGERWETGSYSSVKVVVCTDDLHQV